MGLGSDRDVSSRDSTHIQHVVERKTDDLRDQRSEVRIRVHPSRRSAKCLSYRIERSRIGIDHPESEPNLSDKPTCEDGRRA